MRTALKDIPEREHPRPEGIITVRIDPETGLLARPDQKDAIFEIFRKENAPQQVAPPKETITEESKEQESLPEELF